MQRLLLIAKISLLPTGIFLESFISDFKHRLLVCWPLDGRDGCPIHTVPGSGLEGLSPGWMAGECRSERFCHLYLMISKGPDHGVQRHKAPTGSLHQLEIRGHQIHGSCCYRHLQLGQPCGRLSMTCPLISSIFSRKRDSNTLATTA